MESFASFLNKKTRPVLRIVKRRGRVLLSSKEQICDCTTINKFCHVYQIGQFYKLGGKGNTFFMIFKLITIIILNGLIINIYKEDNLLRIVYLPVSQIPIH